MKLLNYGVTAHIKLLFVPEDWKVANAKQVFKNSFHGEYEHLGGLFLPGKLIDTSIRTA